MSTNLVKLQALVRGSLTRKRLRRDPHFSRLFHRPWKSLVAASMYDGMSLDDYEHGDLLEYSRRRYEERKRERVRKEEEKKPEDSEELGFSDSNEGEEKADPLLSPSADRPVTIPDSLPSEHSKYPPSELQPSDLSALSRPSVSGIEEEKSANRSSDFPLSAASEGPKTNPHSDDPAELLPAAASPAASSLPTYEPDSELQVPTTFSPIQLPVIERNAESPAPNDDFMSAAEVKTWEWEVEAQRDSPEPEAALIPVEKQQESMREIHVPVVEVANQPMEEEKTETEANPVTVNEPQMLVEATLGPVEEAKVTVETDPVLLDQPQPELPPALAPVEEAVKPVAVEETPNPEEKAIAPEEETKEIVEATPIPVTEVEVTMGQNPDGDVKTQEQVAVFEAVQEQEQAGIDTQDNLLYAHIEKQAEKAIVEEPASVEQPAEMNFAPQPDIAFTAELEPKKAESPHHESEPEAQSKAGVSPDITPAAQHIESGGEQEPFDIQRAQIEENKEEEIAEKEQIVMPSPNTSETEQKLIEIAPDPIPRAETPPALDGDFPTFVSMRRNRLELPETEDEPERPTFTPVFAGQDNSFRSVFESQKVADDASVADSPPALPRGTASPLLESLSREGTEYQPAPVPPGVDYSSIRSTEEEPVNERRSLREKDASPPPEQDQVPPKPAEKSSASITELSASGTIFPVKSGELQPTFRVDTPQAPNERQVPPTLTGSPSLTAVGSGQPSFRTPSFSSTPKTPYMGSRDLHRMNPASADTPVKTAEETKIFVLRESLKGLESAGKDKERSLSESSESVKGKQRHSSVQEAEMTQGAGPRLQLSSKVQRTIPHPPQRPRPLHPASKSRSRDASLSLVASDTSHLSKTSFKSPANLTRQGLNQTLPAALQKKPSRELVHIADLCKDKGKSTLYQHRRTQTPEQRLVPISGAKKWASPYDFQWSKRMLERVFRIGVEMKNKQAVYFPEMKVRKLRKSRAKHWEEGLKAEMEMVSQIEDTKV